MIAKYPDYQFYGFEPAPLAFEAARKRLSEFENVSLYNFGLGVTSRIAALYDDQRDGATFIQSDGASADAQIMSVREFLENESIQSVQLMALNIEGGEFELLPYLISSNLIRQIERIMIQWHSVVKNANAIQVQIQSALARTHEMTWNHGAWEAWRLQSQQ
jgi:FkbM family methyltransferase